MNVFHWWFCLFENAPFCIGLALSVDQKLKCARITDSNELSFGVWVGGPGGDVGKQGFLTFSAYILLAEECLGICWE